MRTRNNKWLPYLDHLFPQCMCPDYFFDQYQAAPEILRLTVWDILEREGAGARLEVVQTANQNKIAAIEQAQRDGIVSRRWSPDELLLLILSISTMWMFVTPEVTERSIAERSARRSTVTEAVRALVTSEM